MTPYYQDLCISRWHLDELSSAIDQYESILGDYVNSAGLEVSEVYPEIILRTVCRSIRTLRGILAVSACGLPDEAMALARELYEHFVVLYYLDIHKNDENFQDMISDYFLDYLLQWYKSRKYQLEALGDSSVLDEINSEFSNIKSHAHRKLTGSFWWSGFSTLNTLVSENIKRSSKQYHKFLYELHLLYKRACLSIHHSCSGNMIQLGVSSDFYGIDNRPTSDGLSTPLYFATASFIYVAGTCGAAYGLDVSSSIDKLNELAIFYHLSDDYSGSRESDTTL